MALRDWPCIVKLAVQTKENENLLLRHPPRNREALPRSHRSRQYLVLRAMVLQTKEKGGHLRRWISRSGRSRLGELVLPRLLCYFSCCRRYHSPYPIARDGSDLTPSTFAPNIVDDKMGRVHTRGIEAKPGDKTPQSASKEEGILWVCDRCFKYMADGKSWELHTVTISKNTRLATVWYSLQRNCTVNNPPGEEVHRRGTIKVWEVDGAKAKVDP